MEPSQNSSQDNAQNNSPDTSQNQTPKTKEKADLAIAWMRRHPIITVILGIFVISFCVSLCSEDDNQQSQNVNGKPQSQNINREKLIEAEKAQIATNPFMAVEYCDVDAIKTLHAQKPGLIKSARLKDFDYRNKTLTSTLLHTVSYSNCKNQIEMYKTLIAAGADVNAKDNIGFTPLHKALENPDAVKLLIDAGADVNSKAMLGVTPLMFASGDCLISSAKILIASGANVNISNDNQSTPLHSAVNGSCASMVVLLLSSGANPKVTNSKGYTPLDSIRKKIRDKLSSGKTPTSDEYFIKDKLEEAMR